MFRKLKEPKYNKRSRKLSFPKRLSKPFFYLALGVLVFLGTACSQGDASPQSSMDVRGNVFGSLTNHVHSFVVLPDHVMLLATHYGLFRSQDKGKNWTEVAAGSHQLMEGLMTYSLVSSPLNEQRLYVLTLPTIRTPRGVVGLYTSANQGKTWLLATTVAQLGGHSIYFAIPGNRNANEVYIYLPDLEAHGLLVSRDGGLHFESTGQLPFGRILGLLALPGQPGILLAYGNDGMARSTDGGVHWQILQRISGGITEATTVGAGAPIYASGDLGIYASHDNGATFSLVSSQASYASLSVSSRQHQVVYGKTGKSVYRSINGGQAWESLPAIKGNIQTIVTNPDDPMQVYLSLSYPVEVYRFDEGSVTWQPLTPTV